MTMQPSSEFDLAQKRFKDRQRQQALLVMWCILFGLMFAGNTLFGGSFTCFIVLEILTGAMALVKVIQLSLDALKRRTQDDPIDSADDTPQSDRL